MKISYIEKLNEFILKFQLLCYGAQGNIQERLLDYVLVSSGT